MIKVYDLVQARRNKGSKAARIELPQIKKEPPETRKKTKQVKAVRKKAKVSSGSDISNISEVSSTSNISEVSSTSNISEVSSLSSVSEVSSSSNVCEVGNISSSSNVGKVGNLNNICSVSSLNNICSVSSLSKNYKVSSLNNSCKVGSLNNNCSVSSLKNICSVSKVSSLNNNCSASKVSNISVSKISSICSSNNVSKISYVSSVDKDSKVSSICSSNNVSKISYVSSVDKDSKVSSICSSKNVSKISYVSSVDKDSKVSSVSKGSNFSSVTKDSNISSFTNGSNISSINTGSNISSINKDSNISSLNKGCNISSINKGSNLSSVNQGSNISSISRGSVNKVSDIKSVSKLTQQKEMLALPDPPSGGSYSNVTTYTEESHYSSGQSSHNMRQGMIRPTLQHPVWNYQFSGYGHQFHTRYPAGPSAFQYQGQTQVPVFSPQHNTPTSFHIPFSGGIFKGRHGSGNGGRLNPRMHPSADYFGQFQHLMHRGQDAPVPMPGPIIPHQYYNYMVHTHTNQGVAQNVQSDCHSQPQNHENGMELLQSETQMKPHGTSAAPLSPAIRGFNKKLSANTNQSIPKDGLRSDAWTRKPDSSDKSYTMGYRILKDATTTHIVCSVCCRKNARLCTACGHVAYCGEKCQKIDWPRHQYAECLPPVSFDKSTILSKLCTKQSVIEESCGVSGAGDGPDSEKTLVAEENSQDKETYSGKFLARRFIKKGESIYVVKPIMMASNDKDLPHPPDSILCLECCRWYQSSTGYRCSKCQWPVCSTECENGPLHSNYECPVFVKNSVTPPPNNDYGQFYDDTILALRVILMKVHEPDKFQELYQWKDLEKSMSKTSKWMDYDNRIRTFLIDSCNILELVDGLTYENIQTILLLIDAASIIMDDRVAFRETEHEKTFHCAKYVIPNKLLLSEECSPNCKWSIHHGMKLEDCALRIHAATDILPGIYLSICFSSIWKYGASFINRYEDFRFDFVCSCRRCKDPTEFGSFFSGIKCKQCDVSQLDGYLLPMDPSNALSDWNCQNDKCKSRVKGKVIIEEVNRLHNVIKLRHNDYWQLLDFVFENNRNVLHPNHFLLYKACWACLELFWGSLKGLPFFSQRYEFFNSCTHVAKKALELLDVILPGASIQRGRILFLLSLAEAYRTLRDYRRYLEWGGEDAKKCVPRPFWTIQQIQKESFEILISEPYGSMEHRMALMLQDTIEDQIDLLCHTPINVPLDHMMAYVLHKIYTRFTSSFYEPSIPLFEDEDISKFVVSTGPLASHMVTKKPVI